VGYINSPFAHDPDGHGVNTGRVAACAKNVKFISGFITKYPLCNL